MHEARIFVYIDITQIQILPVCCGGVLNDEGDGSWNVYIYIYTQIYIYIYIYTQIYIYIYTYIYINARVGHSNRLRILAGTCQRYSCLMDMQL